MNWDWLPGALMLGGFVALWVLILPRLKSGGWGPSGCQVGTKPWPRRSASEEIDDLSERPAPRTGDRERRDQRS